MWKQARRHSIRIEGEHSSLVEMSCSRLLMLGGFFMLAFTAVSARALMVGVVDGDLHRIAGERSAEVHRPNSLAARRGDIYDRNGTLLATSLKSNSLYADPYLVRDPADLAARLVKLFPDLDRETVEKALSKKSRFEWIKRPITPAQQDQILELGEPALAFKSENTRVYPQGELAAHMVGFTDRDGFGLSGIERGANETLLRGEDIKITLDIRLQHIVKREVQKAIDDFNAIGGAGIIMDAHNGEILAGVSLPDFNLNTPRIATEDQRFSRLTLGTYELGSVFKAFSTAAFIDQTGAGMGRTFDAREPFKLGRYRVTDYHPQKRILSLPEMFMHSSNIATAKMAVEVGGEGLQKFYSDLGLFAPLDFGIKEVGYPLVPKPWRDSTTVTASYGHGVTSTPMQTAAAMGTIVNGGLLVSPKLLLDNNYEPRSVVRVISEGTSEKMRKLLRLVVTKGTGKNSNTAGYAIGGKTGTAEKSINGRYVKKKLISSFVGAFPIDNPRYVVMVMVDEPVGNKKSYGYATAGWVAAPAVGRIVAATGAVLGMPAQVIAPEHEIDRELHAYVYDPKAGGKKLASY